jgi:Tol biopolymer transport system component
LVSGEPQGVTNLYVRDNASGSYQLVDVTPPGVPPASPTFLAASGDLSHVVFSEEAKLTENAVNGVSNVYEWGGGVVRLLTVLPDGTAVTGSSAGISRDGSRIFFTAGGKLYARLNGASTVQIDSSQAGGTGGGGNFLAAAGGDGSQVFLTDDASAGLTADTVPNSGTNLYQYDFVSGSLSDLTPAAHVEVQGGPQVSEDGSHVYFEAQGALATGATQGQPNSYLWNAGTTKLIPALGKPSANGAFLEIVTSQRLTGYDNTDAITGQEDPEVYLYDAAANSLVCASCNPSGAPPTGGPRPERPEQKGHSSRTVSDTGQVFFETTESLLPADTNGKQDVYEFEPDGVGSCGNADGCLSLLSSGTGSRDTWFIEANPSGDDVFLREYQNLVRQAAQEDFRAIYDVRVDGGLPEPAAPPTCGTADGCRTAPVPQPLFPSVGMGTAAVFGEDNLSAPPSAVGKPKTAAELGAEKLAKALKVCRKAKSKKKRVACDKQAKKKYGPTKKAKNSTAKKVSNDRRAK